MQLTYNDYKQYIADARECKKLSEFMEKSGYTMKNKVPLSVVAEVCKIIYAVSTGNFNELVKQLGCKLTEFGRRYDISIRTLQSWKSGIRTSPDYVLNFIGYIEIMNLIASVDVTNED